MDLLHIPEFSLHCCAVSRSRPIRLGLVLYWLHAKSTTHHVAPWLSLSAGTHQEYFRMSSAAARFRLQAPSACDVAVFPHAHLSWLPGSKLTSRVVVLSLRKKSNSNAKRPVEQKPKFSQPSSTTTWYRRASGASCRKNK